MAKITRATQKIFAQNATTSQLTTFGTAKTANPNNSRNLADIQNANFLSGWASAIEADKAPFEEDTNGLCYAITSQLAYLFQQGTPEWDAGTTYFENSLCTVMQDGILVIKRSLTDNNINNDPTTDNENWADYFSQRVIHTIGDPIITLNPVLEDNEIWLEGAEVSRTTYAALYQIYGTTYGVGDGSTTFNLPDCRNRVFWGAEEFGYIAAGLPNITGNFNGYQLTDGGNDGNGAFYAGGNIGKSTPSSSPDSWQMGFGFDASRSSSIYGNSTTVQPPAIKVRIKTRYQ